MDENGAQILRFGRWESGKLQKEASINATHSITIWNERDSGASLAFCLASAEAFSLW